LIPEARNRINTVFMVTYFVCGVLGTFLAGFAWALSQWDGVSALGASFFGAALIVWMSELGISGRRCGVPALPSSLWYTASSRHKPRTTWLKLRMRCQK
jgi:hypothetical protein